MYVFLLLCIQIYCLGEWLLAIIYYRKEAQEVTRLQQIQAKYLQKDPRKWFSVTVQVPVYNEKYVIARLIDAVCTLQYPADKLQIQIIDDSTDETSAIIAQKLAFYQPKGINIAHIQRSERLGFKAGALQNALASASGELIAIFDADFLPSPTYLLETVAFFEDSNLGLVQTRWQHLNQNYSLLTRLQAFALDAHFTIEQTGRSAGKLFMNFNGTAGIWRKQCIETAGGWQYDTLTEDLDLSYRAQMLGWKFLYTPHISVVAELPADMFSYKTQQFRWIKGGIETAQKLLPQFWEMPTTPKRKFFGLLHLLNTSMYAIVFLCVVLSVPLFWLKNSFISLNYNQFIHYFFLGNVFIFIVYVLSSYNRYNQQKGVGHFLRSFPFFLLLTVGISLHNSYAIGQAIMRKKTDFIRTPKYNIQQKSDNWLGKSYLLFRQKNNLLWLLEGALVGYFLMGIMAAFAKKDFSFLGIHLLGFLGFGLVFGYSIKHWLQVRQKM